MHRNIVFLVVTATLLASSAGGQTGTIAGSVIDRITREALPSANILVVGTTLGASTNPEGRFTIANLPAGVYELRATLVGYEPLFLSDVVVSTARPAEVLIVMDQATIDIDAVEVTASYFRRTPDVPVSVQRLTFEEIRRTPGGFEDVVRGVSVFPGVAVVSNGRNDLVVRGGAPSENLYVLDNIEIPNINHFGTQGSGGGPLSFVNLDYISETAFATGGFGVRYGDRLSSVLSIDLREGRSDRVGGKATVSATQFGLNVEGPVTQKSTFVLSARRSYLDFIFRAADFSFVPEYWDFLGRFNYDIDKSNSITFVGIMALDNVRTFEDDLDDLFENSRVLASDQNQYASGVTWRKLLGSGFMNVTLGRSYVRYEQLQRDSLQLPIFVNDSEESETSLRADVVTRLPGKTELSFGAMLKRVKFESTMFLPEFVSSFGDTIDIDVRGEGDTGFKSSAYLQGHQHLPLGFQATLGIRLDHFDLIDTKFYVAPRASLTYDLTPVTALSASAGIYHQFPSYVWLVTNPLNRALTAARADQYVLGVEHAFRADLRLRVEVYYKDYRDYAASVDRQYLVLSNTGGGFGGVDDNFATFGVDHLVSSGDGRAQGIELLLQKKLSDLPFYGVASVTFSRARFTALDGVERDGSYDQSFIGSLSGGWKIDQAWEVSSKFRIATGRPYTPYNDDGSQEPAAYNSERFPVGSQLDLRVDRRWNFPSWTLIVYLDVQNVTNNTSTGTIRWNEREQRAEFDEGGIGILPSIGISAEL